MAGFQFVKGGPEGIVQWVGACLTHSGSVPSILYDPLSPTRSDAQNEGKRRALLGVFPKNEIKGKKRLAHQVQVM